LGTPSLLLIANDQVQPLEYSPDGKVLAAPAGEEGIIRLYDMTLEKIPQSTEEP
jgi:WD40 repeat protein